MMRATVWVALIVPFLLLTAQSRGSRSQQTDDQALTIAQPLERIGISPLVTLADSTSDGGLPILAMDSRGRYYEGRPKDGHISVFDSHGRLRATFGRYGRGPGEFDSNIESLVVGPGDTVHVFEQMRHDIFAPGTYRFVRAEWL